jgi:hypothetical protein
MLSYIALLPGVLAFLVANRSSPQEAFLKVYLPCLLLLPDYLRAITPGVPDPTFVHSAAIGLLIVSVMKGFPGYRYSPMDLVVGGYAFCVGFSEFLASGYSDAQNLIFGMIAAVMAPYLFAKSYIEPHGARFDFAKRVVLLLFVTACTNAYETRMGLNPWETVLGRFFPGQSSWVVTFRFGFARSAGPFGHALLAGLIFACVFRLQRWLQWSEAWPKTWPPKLAFMKVQPFKPPLFLTLAILFGLLTTFAKGSWLASFIGVLLIVVGRAKNRALGVGLVVVFIVGVLVPATFAFISYASVGRVNAKDDNQETAAYRYELVTAYMDVAMQHGDWGWGLVKWPTDPSYPSIDNHYLLLFLNHGRWALLLFLVVLFGMPVRLIAYAMRAPPPRHRGGSLPFTLASCYLIYIINLATVYLGLQTLPFLFILTGWGTSYMLEGKRDDEGTPAEDVEQKPVETRIAGFRRVL